ncbi:MAG: heme biosynthesis protein HemY [Burkholderiales bacterium]|nr:heme biosynthesis protein HemY [Burkholderiales bacterium]
MRGLFWVVALFSAAVGLSLVARYNDGYVLLFVAPKRIEMSLTLFVILQVAAFVLVYLFVRAAAYTLRLPDQVREFRERRARERARHALFDALISTFEGRYARAERAARVARENGEDRVLAALVGARAAHMLGRQAARDRLLEEARADAAAAGSKAQRQAALMTQAELLVDERRDQEALQVLAELNAPGARHVAAQRLALKAMTRSGAWQDALRVVRQLEEHRAEHPAVIARTREMAYDGLFTGVDAATQRERLRRVPRAELREAPVARTIARALAAQGLLDEARGIVEEALDRGWDEALVELYADCAAETALGRQLERCEAWRVRYPREASLLVCLGRLCAQAQLWGKAREYLELALALRPNRAAHIALAHVCDATGRGDEANRHFRLAAAVG